MQAIAPPKTKRLLATAAAIAGLALAVSLAGSPATANATHMRAGTAGCFAGYGVRGIDVKSNAANFSRPSGTPLRWRSRLWVDNYRTGVHRWFYGAWVNHIAGVTNTGQSWTTTRSDNAYPEIQVEGQSGSYTPGLVLLGAKLVWDAGQPGCYFP